MSDDAFDVVSLISFIAIMGCAGAIGYRLARNKPWFNTGRGIIAAAAALGAIVCAAWLLILTHYFKNHGP
jgi:hypothetical protein